MCDCLEKTNDAFKKEYGCVVTTTINMTRGEVICEIPLSRLGNSRKRLPSLVASYCPFCGEPYKHTIAAKAEVRVTSERE